MLVRKENERGAVTIESAFVIGFFLLVLIIIMESVIVGYRALTVQYVASRTARFAMASTIPAGPARARAVANYAVRQARSFGLSIRLRSQVRVCAVFRDASCRTNDAGGPGEFVYVRVWVPAGFFLGRFNFRLYGEALTKNEFF